MVYNYCTAFMKITFQIFTFIFFFQYLNGQTLLESALNGKSNIVVEKPTKINLGNYNFKTREFLNWLDLNKAEFDKKDTTEIKTLINKAKSSKPIYKGWTEKELPNKILIGHNEFISIKNGLEIIPWETKEDKKRIKKEIRKYNNRGTEWRSFPLSMSRPVYSDNREYALIGFIRGNSGGNVSLYKKNDLQNWKYIEDIYGWAY